jgi:hypothetical protein
MKNKRRFIGTETTKNAKDFPKNDTSLYYL